MKISRRRMIAGIAAAVMLSAPTVVTANAAEFHGQWVKGKILEAYNRLGGYSRLGNATTNELNAGRGGKFQVFDNTLNSIYWHPLVDNGTAHQVKGRIRDKWRDFGWENGRLMYPITDELTPPDGAGRFNHFEGGSIYWHPATGPNEIEGRIKDRWEQTGWEIGPLGYPTTDELTTPDNRGKFNHFQNGSIYWTSDTGAHSVKGRIHDYWSGNGWETGEFGYPISEEFDINGAVQQNFEKGNLQWVPNKGGSLPEYESSWGSYSQLYTLFTPEMERWSPAQINREVTTHFDTYFTYTGCGEVLKVGATCNLETVIGVDAPVKVVDISDTGFALLSLDGHPEGANRHITFNFERYPVGGANDIRLLVEAWGPRGGASYFGPLNSGTAARVSWSRFSRNIQQRIDNARTTYITGDSHTPQTFSALRPNLPEDTEIIDPNEVDTSGVTNKIPLEPIQEGNSGDAFTPKSSGTRSLPNIEKPAPEHSRGSVATQDPQEETHRAGNVGETGRIPEPHTHVLEVEPSREPESLEFTN